MKTEFDLEMGAGDLGAGHLGNVKIIGNVKKNESPYLAVYVRTSLKTTQFTGWIPDDQLERFAVNILKALKSKRLKGVVGSKLK